MSQRAFALLLVFVAVVEILVFMSGHWGHYPPAPVPIKSDTVRGTYIIWYSNTHKMWRATALSGPIYDLTNTSMIDHLVSSTKHYPGYQRESGCCVSFIAELELRYLKTDRKPAPGDIPSMEVVRVDLVRTDFCFHDDHAPKARRE